MAIAGVGPGGGNGTNCALSGAGYDCRGNLAFDGVRSFTYDEENHLVGESGPATAALSYDPLGRLCQTVINGTTTNFLYSGAALVAEYDGSWTLLRRYVDGPGTDDPIQWIEGASVTASAVRSLIKDRQGSVIGWSDTTGALQASPTPYPERPVGAALRYAVLSRIDLLPTLKTTTLINRRLSLWRDEKRGSRQF